MNLARTLKRAKYISRGDDGKYIGNQCGFTCEYAVIMNNGTNNSYLFCERFQMKVGDYDSCKYYKESKDFSDAMQSLVKLINEGAFKLDD